MKKEFGNKKGEFRKFSRKEPKNPSWTKVE